MKEIQKQLQFIPPRNDNGQFPSIIEDHILPSLGITRLCSKDIYKTSFSHRVWEKKFFDECIIPALRFNPNHQKIDDTEKIFLSLQHQLYQNLYEILKRDSIVHPLNLGIPKPFQVKDTLIDTINGTSIRPSDPLLIVLFQLLESKFLNIDIALSAEFRDTLSEYISAVKEIGIPLKAKEYYWKEEIDEQKIFASLRNRSIHPNLFLDGLISEDAIIDAQFLGALDYTFERLERKGKFRAVLSLFIKKHSLTATIPQHMFVYTAQQAKNAIKEHKEEYFSFLSLFYLLREDNPFSIQERREYSSLIIENIRVRSSNQNRDDFALELERHVESILGKDTDLSSTCLRLSDGEDEYFVSESQQIQTKLLQQQFPKKDIVFWQGISFYVRLEAGLWYLRPQDGSTVYTKEGLITEETQIFDFVKIYGPDQKEKLLSIDIQDSDEEIFLSGNEDRMSNPPPSLTRVHSYQKERKKKPVPTKSVEEKDISVAQKQHPAIIEDVFPLQSHTAMSDISLKESFEQLQHIRHEAQNHIPELVEWFCDTDRMLSNMAFVETTKEIRKCDRPQILTVSPKDIQNKDVWCIGDVHGDLLGLLASINAAQTLSQERNRECVIIFLGDLVDDGHDMLAVLYEVMRRVHNEPHKYLWLAGNHDIATRFNKDTDEFYSRVSPSSFVNWLNTNQQKQLGLACISFVERLPYLVFLPNGLMLSHAAFPQEDLNFKNIAELEGDPCTRNDCLWGRLVKARKRRFSHRRSLSFEAGAHNFHHFCTDINKTEIPQITGSDIFQIVRGHDHCDDTPERWNRFVRSRHWKQCALTINNMCFDMRDTSLFCPSFVRNPVIAKISLEHRYPIPYKIDIPEELVNQYAPRCMKNHTSFPRHNNAYVNPIGTTFCQGYITDENGNTTLCNHPIGVHHEKKS